MYYLLYLIYDSSSRDGIEFETADSLYGAWLILSLVCAVIFPICLSYMFISGMFGFVFISTFFPPVFLYPENSLSYLCPVTGRWKAAPRLWAVGTPAGLWARKSRSPARWRKYMVSSV